ncbi:MAG: DNA translocase FtsK, partial [Clostridia bacterium]|nr:DNA translocase FtsK [Clostridia bacterium]
KVKIQEETHIKFNIEDEDDELPESLSDRLKKRKSNPATAVVNDFAKDIDAGRVVPAPDIYDENLFKDEEDIFEVEIEEMNEDEPEPAEEKPVKEKNLSESEKAEYSEEIENSMMTEVVEYQFPTIDLLDTAKKSSGDQRRELYEKAEQLIAVLDNFGVKAKPVQVTQGPTVTRYEIQPESGVKLSKIVGLADDIALNLAVSTVLIAPVPGKAATVGVEIPNNSVTPVSIREMIDSPEFKNAKSKLTVCLGKDIGGNVITGDIAKWPHALIAGATGSGKSVCINTIITSILYKADPNEVKLIMVDPKQVELGVYNGIPHLLIPVVTEAKKAAGALNWAVTEMMHRYELFKNSGVRKLEMYNKLMEKTGGEKLPQLVIIIDELADLMMVAAKEVEDYVCRLAQRARAAGIHLIIATQRPSVDVITGLIKANIPSRIAFSVSSQIDSRTILDKVGAEKLLGMGDMLYFPTGARSTTRVQGAFVSDDEVERIVNHIKETSPVTHYREDLEDHIERISLGENGVTPDKDDDGDALLNDAIKLSIELGQISTSMIQRRLGVGYSRAGRIIDQMEARGIVSPPNGSKPRDVLVSHADMLFGDSVAEDDEFEE